MLVNRPGQSRPILAPMVHIRRNQPLMRIAQDARVARPHGSAQPKTHKAPVAGYLPRMWRSVIREVAGHPASTLISLMAGLAIVRLALGRRRRLHAVSSPKASQTGKVASAGLLAAICLLLLSGCALLPQEPIRVQPDAATFGRKNDLSIAGEQLARERCMRCHAIHGELERGEAPPLDKLLLRRTSDELADYLVAGLPMDHGNMPVFEFNTVGAMSLVAYIESIAQ